MYNLKRNCFLSLLVLAVSVTACSSAGSGRFNTAKDFSGYSAVYVAPVEVSRKLMDKTDPKIGSRLSDRDRPLAESDISAKVNDLHVAIIGAVSQVRPITQKPDDGVVSIFTELTDLEANRPTRADYRINPGLSARSQYSGGASAVFVLRDSDGELARFEDSYYGDLQDNRGFGIWSDADRAFRRWARQLADVISGQ